MYKRQHSYNERIARIKETHGLEDEPNVALRLQALRWERDYVGELIEREEVYPIVGYQYQSRLSHIEKLLKHNAVSYTHLDVYKRQKEYLAAQEQKRREVQQHLLGLGTVSSNVEQVWNFGLGVLDVYKRQDVGCAVRLARGRAEPSGSNRLKQYVNRMLRQRH